MLSSNVDDLQTIILNGFNEAISAYRETIPADGTDAKSMKRRSNMAMLLAEYSHAQIEYWGYEACEEAIKEAFDLLGINVNLDGKFGRRTKWQTFDLAQLVLDVKTKDVHVKKIRDLQQPTGASVDGESSTQYVRQDEESILWEQPKLNEEEENAPDVSAIGAKELRVED